MKRISRPFSLHSDLRKRQQRRFRFESLERRLLLAADTVVEDPIIEMHGVLGDTGGVISTSEIAAGEGESAEGELVRDLVAVAKELTKVGVKFFGADWCPACTAQKQLFDDGGQFLPFIEVTNPDRTLNQIGIDNQIQAFPTWEFPDGSRETGIVDVATLIQRSLIADIQGETPSIAPIGNVELFSGAPIHLALDGYDPDGDAISYTASVNVTSGNLNLETFIPEGNTSLLFDTSGFGPFTVELFNGRAPGPADHVRQLAEQNFYDGLTVHRVIDGFMIQTGSPNGDGTGGSSLGSIDDQFHPDLLHTSPGTLSQAKGGDDTGDSQIFFIDEATRFLDFNHAVFGKIKEGDANRNAISRTAVEANSLGELSKPIRDVIINSVTTFIDTEDAVLMLKAPEGESGTADVTITATDTDGNSSSHTFTVTVTPDTFDGGPYLDTIGTITGESNRTIRFTPSHIDVEGDPVFFDAARNGNVPYEFTIDNDTGLVEIDAPEDFVGELTILVGVRALNGSDTSDAFDTQLVTVNVLPERPTVDLLGPSDTGVSSVDNITNLNNADGNSTLDFLVTGGFSGATVDVFAGDVLIGTGTAASDVTITTDGATLLANGTHEITATQTIDGETSPASNPITLTIDTAVGQFTSDPLTGGIAEQAISHNVDSTEEGSAGFAYSLSGAPTGVTIDPITGLLEWTPTTAQIGSHSFQVVASDAAGNTLAQDFDLEIASDALVLYRIFTTDLQGNPITEVNAGDDFLLQVNVRDISEDRNGVFAGYLDVETINGLISFTGPVTPGEEFPNTVTGSFNNPTVADEIGAIAGFQPTGSSELPLVSVRTRADLAGTETFVAAAADDFPASHTLLFADQVQAVPLNQIIFGRTELTILPSAGAQNDTFNFDEDSSNHTLAVLANDSVTSGSDPSQLVITGVGQPDKGGTVDIAGDGKSLLYTPAPNAFGVETFTYDIDDGAGTDTATVTIQLQPLNDVPVGQDDDVTVGQNSSANVLDVLSNDEIAPDENETLTITNVTDSQIGADITISAGGANIVYTPPFGFIGSDEFVYTFEDGNGASTQAIVRVDIVQTNDPPVAVDDEFDVLEDSANVVLQVLANDTTEDGEQLTISSVGQTTAGGSVFLDNNAVNYTPPANFFGIDTFQYTIDDGNSGTATATVTIDVENVNDPPIANDDTVNLSRDVARQVLRVLDNDSTLPDAADEPVQIDSVGTSNVGATVEISADAQTILYTPPVGFTGSDIVTYTVEDSEGETATATVNIEVLEFQLSSLSGFVYFDVNNDGVFAAPELPIGGVVISLIGTNVFGDAVQLQTTTMANGSYQFTDLLPGSYVIVETQPSFLLDGADAIGTAGGDASVSDQFSIELPQGTDGQNYNFGERGREARYIGIQSLFARRHVDGGLLAATDPSTGQEWYSLREGWDFQSANVTVAQDMVSIDVAVNDGTQDRSVRIAPDFNNSLSLLGREGDLHFFEVVGASSRYFTPEDNGGGGEGELPASTSQPIATAPVTSLATSPATAGVHQTGGEGEATAVAVDPTARELAVAAMSQEAAVDSDVFGALTTTRVDVEQSLPIETQLPIFEHQRIQDQAIEMYVGTGSARKPLPDLLDREADLDSLLPPENVAPETTEQATDTAMHEEEDLLEDLLADSIDQHVAVLAVDQIFGE